MPRDFLFLGCTLHNSGMMMMIVMMIVLLSCRSCKTWLVDGRAAGPVEV